MPPHLYLDIATRKGLFQLTPKNSQWRIAHVAFPGDEVTMLLRDAARGCLYAAIRHGHFGVKHHIASVENDGAARQWREITTPAYPPKPEDAPDILCPVRGKPIPWSLEMTWSLELGADEGELWCGTIPGGLFHSTDAGESWSLVRSLWNRSERAKWFGGGYDYPGIHSICIDPRDKRRLRVGVSCGGVWTSLDNGQSWACTANGMRAAYMPPDQAGDPNIQDPHRVVQCPSQPDKLWAQHHNGIFRSTDGGGNWREIQCAAPSSFGFAAVVHPHDGNAAWFVPAIKDEQRIPVDGRFVVTRTRDGGEQFDVLTNGLPQEHAYDIVYRHALDIDESGDRLAMGSTTGSLFLSEDQGDHWRCVSNHLPPIYAVRFAKSQG